MRRRRRRPSRRARRRSACAPRSTRPRSATRGTSRSRRSPRSTRPGGASISACCSAVLIPIATSKPIPGGAGASSGWMTWASSSIPSTSRGPGRENDDAASTATTRSAPSERSALRERPRDRAPPRRRRGRTASRRRSPGAPPRARPSRRRPTCAPARRSRRRRPAASIISGTQWPPMNTGSSHSSAATRGRRAPATRRADGLDPRLELGCAATLPSPGRPAAPAIVSRSPSTSPRVSGIERDHVAERSAGGRRRRGRRRRRRRRPRTAPGSRSASGRARAGAPRRGGRATRRGRSPRARGRRSPPGASPVRDHARGQTGEAASAAAGWSHSWVTATTSSPSPSANSASVADGTRLAMRISRRI